MTAQNEKRDEDILNPPYAINNAAGPLSSKTSWVRFISSSLFIWIGQCIYYLTDKRKTLQRPHRIQRSQPLRHHDVHCNA